MSYVAFQYAEALFSFALESQQISEVKTAYNEFLNLKDSTVTKFLNHPKVTKDEKKEVLKTVVTNTAFLHFLFVLLDNSRMELIEDCFLEFSTIIQNQQKVLDVQVYSQKALTGEELNDLKINIGKKHNRTVTIENIVDSTIVGGLRIEYDGYVLDQTINRYLYDLKHNLTK